MACSRVTSGFSKINSTTPARVLSAAPTSGVIPTKQKYNKKSHATNSKDEKKTGLTIFVLGQFGAVIEKFLDNAGVAAFGCKVQSRRSTLGRFVDTRASL